MLIVPLQPLPNLTLQSQLNNQACTINLQQYPAGIFLTLYVGGNLIIASVLCKNLVRIVRDVYLGFQGDLVFLNTQGTDDPVYTGLGGRYQLVYLDPSDLATFGVAG
jgi:hypothetical protein